MLYITTVTKKNTKAQERFNDYQSAEDFANQYGSNGEWNSDVESVVIEYIINANQKGIHFAWYR